MKRAIEYFGRIISIVYDLSPILTPTLTTNCPTLNHWIPPSITQNCVHRIKLLRQTLRCQQLVRVYVICDITIRKWEASDLKRWHPRLFSVGSGWPVLMCCYQVYTGRNMCVGLLLSYACRLRNPGCDWGVTECRETTTRGHCFTGCLKRLHIMYNRWILMEGTAQILAIA